MVGDTTSSWAVHKAMTALRGRWGPDKERGQNDGEATLKQKNLCLQQLKTFKQRLVITGINGCYYQYSNTRFLLFPTGESVQIKSSLWPATMEGRLAVLALTGGVIALLRRWNVTAVLIPGGLFHQLINAIALPLVPWRDITKISRWHTPHHRHN